LLNWKTVSYFDVGRETATRDDREGEMFIFEPSGVHNFLSNNGFPQRYFHQHDHFQYGSNNTIVRVNCHFLKFSQHSG
jgi:hypothetical protein